VEEKKRKGKKRGKASHTQAEELASENKEIHRANSAFREQRVLLLNVKTRRGEGRGEEEESGQFSAISWLVAEEKERKKKKSGCCTHQDAPEAEGEDEGDSAGEGYGSLDSKKDLVELRVDAV